MSDLHDEAARQQALLAALWPAHGPHGRTPAALEALSPHLRAGTPVSAARGLQAYRLNAGAAAERALSTSFPVLRALVGPDDFAALARAFWLACPPTRGDLAWSGQPLADFIAQDDGLRAWPYLADVARLEWRVARAESAADDPLSDEAAHATLQRLGDTDPATLTLRLAPGTALLASPWPVASLWLAHGAGEARPADDAPLSADEDALARVRARMRAGEGEHALAWRQGWRVRVAAIPAPDAGFVARLLAQADLATALDAAAAAGDFRFDSWLVDALSTGLLRGTSPLARPGAPPG